MILPGLHSCMHGWHAHARSMHWLFDGTRNVSGGLQRGHLQSHLYCLHTVGPRCGLLVFISSVVMAVMAALWAAAVSTKWTAAVQQKKRIGAGQKWKALRNGGLSTCSPVVATRNEVKCETERGKNKKTKKKPPLLCCYWGGGEAWLVEINGKLFGVDDSRPASSTGPAAQSGLSFSAEATREHGYDWCVPFSSQQALGGKRTGGKEVLKKGWYSF